MQEYRCTETQSSGIKNFFPEIAKNNEQISNFCMIFTMVNTRVRMLYKVFLLTKQGMQLTKCSSSVS